jgi:hypothetical protein
MCIKVSLLIRLRLLPEHRIFCQHKFNPSRLSYAFPMRGSAGFH